MIDADALPISSVETFLRHLAALGYSPNTVKAYAHDLADLFTWLQFRRLNWRTLTVADVGEWVAWLRLPGPARQGRVGVLPSIESAVGERTLQRKLAAGSAFYGFHRRLDPDVTLQLTRWDRGFASAGYQPFLAHTRRQQARQEVRVRGVLRSAPEVRGLPGAARRVHPIARPVLASAAARDGHADWRSARTAPRRPVDRPA